MTRSYAPTTMDAVADANLGLRVEVPTFPTATYLHQDQWELFHVYGRIQIRHLFLEFITDSTGGAAYVAFNYTFTTPTITVKPLTGASGDTVALVRGSRVVCLGGAVSTAAGITVATGGMSDLAITPGILGGEGFVGTIGLLTTNGDNTGGTAKAVLFYLPMSDGAYVEPNAVPTAPPG